MALRTGGVQIECGAGRRGKTADRILDFDLSAELNHGIVVSNLAYAVASSSWGWSRRSVMSLLLRECFTISAS